MQLNIATMLQQKNHLAALGLAVSKINHDLRNLLSSAQLFSERLAKISDPHVQRFAPKLMRSLERAIAFCQSTLSYGRAIHVTESQDVHRTEACSLCIRPMPPPTAAHVQTTPRPSAGHHRHRGVELGSAVAAARAEHVTGEALRVHTHQHVVPVAVRRCYVATDQRHVLDVVVDAPCDSTARNFTVPERQRGAWATRSMRFSCSRVAIR